jgi:hypothetical protein
MRGSSPRPRIEKNIGKKASARKCAARDGRFARAPERVRNDPPGGVCDVPSKCAPDASANAPKGRIARNRAGPGRSVACRRAAFEPRKRHRPHVAAGVREARAGAGVSGPRPRAAGRNRRARAAR